MPVTRSYDYDDISRVDPDTNVTGAELEELTDASETTLHSHAGGGGGISNVVEDLTPQLGGDLDANGFNIGFDDATGIEDDSGNYLIKFQKTASAVNYLEITNATDIDPTVGISVEGTTANIGLALQGKGTGGITLVDDVLITGTLDLDGVADGLILDADADTTISAPTDDQIDIEIAGADDFRFTANTFTALSGSTIATNTISETTAASGVTIDGVILKDQGIDTAAGDLTIDAADDVIIAPTGDISLGSNTEIDLASDIIRIGSVAAEDFRVTPNTLTALSGSTIATNTIAETTAGSGVTIDSNLLKDGLINRLNVATGWVEANETWTYASALTYSNTNTTRGGTFTITGDVTSKYTAGMRVKFTQATGGTKYGIVVLAAYSDPSTTITIFLGTDFTLNNEAISSPYYSTMKSPQGMDMSHTKWQLIRTETAERSTTSQTLASLTATLAHGPGAWTLSLSTPADLLLSANVTRIGVVTLSSDATNETDADLTGGVGFGNNDADRVFAQIYTSKPILKTTATTWTLMGRVSGTSATLMINEDAAGWALDTNIRAVCAYL